MHNPLLALTLTLATTATALGQAKVVNNCDFAVSVWSVGSAVSSPHRLSAHGGSYGETFSRDPQTGGRALKVTVPADGLWTGAPQADFAYNLDGAQVWYDLSDVFGDPFAGHKVVVASADASCPAIVWGNGTPPAGSQVKVCTADQSVTFTLCAA
ncbi:hypothetical protein QBC33DRAFT_525164 [Phialemonium atrogriseum]|uniref:Bys1 family protein n=1 Tax=Phialemonium atrogriseum TaxID=1093897 RepID=A0AAJ0FKS4_9PEZI|nr:uncharacterized protein QBC33DRAFT_525164 [Phialemonium atrogriseum]KAK1771911.1 hypothetical protein QBC33DRAFT_525164 [Phialemonium atrogriseum]